MKKETMSICDKRGHYYLPIDIPVQEGFTWSVTPPKPERKLYCRRCGKTQSLNFNVYKSTNWGNLTITNSSSMTTLPFVTYSSGTLTFYDTFR